MQIDLTDPASIAANQRGELTEEQRQRATRAARGHRGCLDNLLRRAFLPALGFALMALLMAIRAPTLIVWVVLFISLIVGTELFMLTVPPLIQRQVLLRRDLAEERLEMAEGHLIYVGHGYEAVTDNATLLLPGRTLTQLRPDSLYRFYFLPRSGYVLSAELVGAAATADVRAALLEAFSKALGFDLKTLASNRGGQLTAGQRLWLLPHFFMVAADFTPRQLWTDIVVGRTEATEGIGCRVTLPRPYRSHAYQIGARRFAVPSRAFEVIIDDLPYRAYHTPHSGILVSIEPLAGRANQENLLDHVPFTGDSCDGFPGDL